ncbi:MAG: hypothetical protein JW882_15820 [Deltaproteobacteria bacterium]|nr:hypothetical protein [Deltaproteobacteria bacterium]
MKENAAAERLTDSGTAPEKSYDLYYCVEIPISRLGVIYQFKIWDIESMSILVKGNSRVLPWLKKGYVLNMKYYSTDPENPYRNFNTEIRYVKRQENGRLQDHYLVGLEILESDGQSVISWPYRPDGPKMLPFDDILRNTWRA